MTILIITGNHLFSIALRAVIKNQYPHAVIVEADSFQNALELSKVSEFQAMILDVGAADAKDTVSLSNFKTANPQTRILVNLADQTELMHKFIRAGVTALFSNKSLPEEINEGLRQTKTNTRYISSDIAQQLLFHIVKKPINQVLTKKEEFIADLLVANKSHQQIAVIAGISSKNVGYYKRRVFQKLEVDNLIDLAIKLNKVSLNNHSDR